ncbi:MAG: DNA (cytosine-5-)-methyltransferase [Bacilli bacterium]
MKKTVVELFAGVGGFRVGLNDIHNIDNDGKAIENGNWNFVWANQWEPSTKIQHAFDCYTKRFGISNSHSNEDITTIDKNTIPNHSLLVGGFPCQDYSVARTVSGEKGIEGKKGVLFWQITEILETKNTPFVLLENVDRLLKSPAKQRGRDFGIMLRTFHDLGYNVEWRVINAAEYGCAQRRRRVFIFAWKRDSKYNTKLNKETAKSILLKKGLFAKAFPIFQDPDYDRYVKHIDILSFKDQVEMTSNFNGDFKNSGNMINGNVATFKSTPIYINPITLNDIQEKREIPSQYMLSEIQDKKFIYLKGGKSIDRVKPNGEKYLYSEGTMAYPDELSLPGRTMLTSEASINRSTHIIVDYVTNKRRFITPIEAERMQAFPDNWTDTGMPEKRRYFMMGNALVTKIINMLEPTLNDIISKS